MTRIVGRMQKRNGGKGATGFIIQISSIWEAGWNDVDWARGIV